MANNVFGGNINPATPVAPSVTGVTPPMNRSLGGTMPIMPNQQMNVPPQVQTNVIYVDNMQQVLDHPRTPNEHMYFPEKTTNVIWVRETDANAEIKNPLIRLTCKKDEVTFGPEANFVTKAEHQELYNLVSSMNATLNKLMDELGGSSK